MSIDEQERRRRPYERDERLSRYALQGVVRQQRYQRSDRPQTGPQRQGPAHRPIERPRTIGVTVKDDREWTEARIRAARSTDGDAA